jgi:hypothetical protein
MMARESALDRLHKLVLFVHNIFIDVNRIRNVVELMRNLMDVYFTYGPQNRVFLVTVKWMLIWSINNSDV